MPAERSETTKPIPIVALLLAWLVPGAGHVYLGRLYRGLIIFVIVSAIFWAGIAMGGVLTMDYRSERWWFVAQVLTGVHGLVGWQRQRNVYEDMDARVANDEEFIAASRPYVEAREWSTVAALQQEYTAKLLAKNDLALVAPTDTVARAYAGVAGLLNLLCIFDALLLSLMGVSGETTPKPTTAGKEKAG